MVSNFSQGGAGGLEGDEVAGKILFIVYCHKELEMTFSRLDRCLKLSFFLGMLFKFFGGKAIAGEHFSRVPVV